MTDSRLEKRKSSGVETIKEKLNCWEYIMEIQIFSHKLIYAKM